MKNKKYIIHWRDGTKQKVEGYDIAHAFNSAGIGRGALIAVDYYEQEIEADDKKE